MEQQTLDKDDLAPFLASFGGRINDTDAHECAPINLWREQYGSVVTPFIDAIHASSMNIKGTRVADDAEITPHNIWNLKMEEAPGAWDLGRRLDVMDLMGIRRQLMFPGTMGVLAVGLYTRAHQSNFFGAVTGDRKGYARELHAAHNDWCVRVASFSERLRPVAILVQESPEELAAVARDLTSKGIRAFWIPTDQPLAGVSPADPALDPLWDVIAGAKAVVTGHIGSHEGLLRTLKWRDAPAFEGYKAGEEFTFDPWSVSTYHLGMQVFLTTMILGGVFDRHPDLTFGSAEFCGHWVGPLADNMDRWMVHRPFKSSAGPSRLKLRPSEYLQRNVRVACFGFEPIGEYIDRFGLEEVYCFASDFPHHEGGKNPIGDFIDGLKDHGPPALEKFFVSNGRDLLPD